MGKVIEFFQYKTLDDARKYHQMIEEERALLAQEMADLLGVEVEVTLGMTWDKVDLEDGVFKTQNRPPFNKQAMDILNRVQKVSVGSAIYVFSNQNGSYMRNFRYIYHKALTRQSQTG